MKKKLMDFLRNEGALMIALMMAVIISKGCPIRQILGIPCPGCGITRACEAALHLDFASALHYHPLFWIFPLVFLYIIFGKKPLLNSKKKEKIFYVSTIIVIFSVYIYRMINMFPTIEPMTYDKDSILGTIFYIFKNRIIKS